MRNNILNWMLNSVVAEETPMTNMLPEIDLTNCIVTGGVTLDSGNIIFDDVTSGVFRVNQENLNAPIVADTAFVLTFIVSGTSGGGIYASITSVDLGEGGGSVTYVGAAEYSDGAKTVNFTAPADIIDGGLRIFFNIDGDSGGTISNINLMPA